MCTWLAYVLGWRMFFVGVRTLLVYILGWRTYLVGIRTWLAYVLGWRMYLVGLQTWLAYVLEWHMYLVGVQTWLVYKLSWGTHLVPYPGHTCVQPLQQVSFTLDTWLSSLDIPMSNLWLKQNKKCNKSKTQLKFENIFSGTNLK